MDRDFDRNPGERDDACPLQVLIQTSATVGADEEKSGPFGTRVKRALKRRLSVRVQRRLKGLVGSAADLFRRRRRRSGPAGLPPAQPAGRLEAGDLVRVLSMDEIASTLDHWHSLKGCGFLREMSGYCGTTQKVMKRVERFMDERDYRFKRASGVVLLEGAICSGTSGTGRCDRSCFFFWREEWLEKLAGPPQ